MGHRRRPYVYGHFSLVNRQRDTSLEYWVKAITEHGLFQMRDDMTGVCKFTAMSPDMMSKPSNTRSDLRFRLGSCWQQFVACTWRTMVRA